MNILRWNKYNLLDIYQYLLGQIYYQQSQDKNTCQGWDTHQPQPTLSQFQMLWQPAHLISYMQLELILEQIIFHVSIIVPLCMSTQTFYLFSISDDSKSMYKGTAKLHMLIKSLSIIILLVLQMNFSRESTKKC